MKISNNNVVKKLDNWEGDSVQQVKKTCGSLVYHEKVSMNNSPK